MSLEGAGVEVKPSGTAGMALQALTTFAVFEAVRVLFPLLFAVRESSGAGVAVGIALLAFLAPIVVGPLHRLAGDRRATLVAVVLLAAGRVGFAFVHPIPVWLAAGTTAVGFVAWTLGWRHAQAHGDSSRAVIGLVLGLAADTAVRTAFLSWDAAWRTGWAPTLVAIVLASGLIGLAVIDRERTGQEPAMPNALLLALLGPFLLLQLQFLQNPAFVASAADLSLPAGAGLVLIGDALAIVAIGLLNVGPAWTARGSLAAAISLGGTAAVAVSHGPLVAAALPVTQMAVVGLLARGITVSPKIATREGAWRTGLATALGMAAFVLFAFAYQIHIDVPLPVPRPIWPLLAAGMLALAAARRAGSGRRVPPRIFAILPLVGLVVPAMQFVTAPVLRVETSDGAPVRILDWNLHGAVNGDGQVGLETIAHLIELQAPDVVVLQEVARGWPITGTADVATWLSRRLGIRFAWAPAADDQFGNLVLSHFRIEEVEVIPLPYGLGPQHRSALRVVLDAGFPERLTVIATHLQNGVHPSTGRAQIGVLIDTWSDGVATIIAGDMNVQPTADNATAFIDAGLVSAQDATGNGSSSTARNPNFPGDRVDWIFGSPDLTFSEFAILESQASDHLPLVVMVAPS